MRKLFTVGQPVKDVIEEKGYWVKNLFASTPEFNVLLLADLKMKRKSRLIVTDNNDCLRYEIEVGPENGFSNNSNYHHVEKVIKVLVAERGRILFTRYVKTRYQHLSWSSWNRKAGLDEDGIFLLKVIDFLDENDVDSEIKSSIRRLMNRSITLSTQEKVNIGENGENKWILIERLITPTQTRKESVDNPYISLSANYYIKIVKSTDYGERYWMSTRISARYPEMTYPNMKKVLPELIALAKNAIETQEKIKNIK